MEEKETKPITERLKELEEKIDTGKNGKIKTKKLRMNKMKVKKARMKKGYIGVLRVGVNRGAYPEKCQIEDSSYRTSDGTYHSFDGSEILFLNGKTPFVIQPEIKINPMELITGKNETRGQKLVQARIIKDTIKVKKAGGGKGLIIIVVIAVIGFILGKFVFKWF